MAKGAVVGEDVFLVKLAECITMLEKRGIHKIDDDVWIVVTGERVMARVNQNARMSWDKENNKPIFLLTNELLLRTKSDTSGDYTRFQIGSDHFSNSVCVGAPFIGDSELGLSVDHSSRVKGDNRLSNLAHETQDFQNKTKKSNCFLGHMTEEYWASDWFQEHGDVWP